jgi:DNA-binding XRE family transcriptional regulator
MKQTPYTLEQSLEEALKNPEFKHIWEANSVRRELTKTIIGERIKRKLTQRELAERAGLKQSSIARVENGGTLPSISTLARIAQAFGKRLSIQFME